MPCLSWLVNARNRGVRGSGPPGFRREPDATDRAGLFVLAGRARGTPAQHGKGPRAQMMVEVWANVIACRGQSPARLPSARRLVDFPRQLDALVRPVSGRPRALCEPRGGIAQTGETAHTSRAGRSCVHLTLLCGANRTHLEPRGGRGAVYRAATGVPGGPGPGKTQQPLQPG